MKAFLASMALLFLANCADMSQHYRMPSDDVPHAVIHPYSSGDANAVVLLLGGSGTLSVIVSDIDGKSLMGGGGDQMFADWDNPNITPGLHHVVLASRLDLGGNLTQHKAWPVTATFEAGKSYQIKASRDGFTLSVWLEDDAGNKVAEAATEKAK